MCRIKFSLLWILFCQWTVTLASNFKDCLKHNLVLCIQSATIVESQIYISDSAITDRKQRIK